MAAALHLRCAMPEEETQPAESAAGLDSNWRIATTQKWQNSTTTVASACRALSIALSTMLQRGAIACRGCSRPSMARGGSTKCKIGTALQMHWEISTACRALSKALRTMLPRMRAGAAACEESSVQGRCGCTRKLDTELRETRHD